jgi:alpha-D-xyloside xylohydrolase
LPKLPAGEKWIDCASGNAFEGGQKIQVDCPLDKIPVFARNDFDIKIY